MPAPTDAIERHDHMPGPYAAELGGAARARSNLQPEQQAIVDAIIRELLTAIQLPRYPSELTISQSSGSAENVSTASRSAVELLAHIVRRSIDQNNPPHPPEIGSSVTRVESHTTGSDSIQSIRDSHQEQPARGLQPKPEKSTPEYEAQTPPVYGSPPEVDIEDQSEDACVPQMPLNFVDRREKGFRARYNAGGKKWAGRSLAERIIFVLSMFFCAVSLIAMFVLFQTAVKGDKIMGRMVLLICILSLFVFSGTGAMVMGRNMPEVILVLSTVLVFGILLHQVMDVLVSVNSDQQTSVTSSLPATRNALLPGRAG